MQSRHWFLNAAAAAAVVALPLATANANTLYDSALVYYEFETLGAGGEVTDSGSNGVDLLAVDTQGFGTPANLITGVNGNGLNLPDPVVLTTTGTASDDSILNVTRDTSFSVAAWVKLENNGDRFFLASKVIREDVGDGDGLELRGWSFDIGTGGKLTGLWRQDHTPVSGTTAEARIIVDSDTTITDTEWHHVALTFDYDESDATRGMRLYLDGALLSMTASSTGLAGAGDIDLSNDSPFNLSGRYDSQLNEGGSVDDFAIWNSVLSATDIASLAGVSVLIGDLNGDGFVGIGDLNIVLGNWNQNVTAGDPLQGDPSNDGFVGIDDLNTVLGNWNSGTPPAATAVPEPASLTLLGIASVAALRRRRM